MMSENIAPVIRRGNDVCGVSPQIPYPTQIEDRNWPRICYRNSEEGSLRIVYKDGRSEDYVRAKHFRGPANQHYASPSSRMETFKEWTGNEIISSEKLVEAGFYYLG